jgi:hypothetical protein
MINHICLTTPKNHICLTSSWNRSNRIIFVYQQFMDSTKAFYMCQKKKKTKAFYNELSAIFLIPGVQLHTPSAACGSATDHNFEFIFVSLYYFLINSMNFDFLSFQFLCCFDCCQEIGVIMTLILNFCVRD